MEAKTAFDRAEAFDLVSEWASVCELVVDGRHRLVGRDPDGRARVRITLPRSLSPLAPIVPLGRDADFGPRQLEAWAETCRNAHGRELYMLLQAGASAVGVFDRLRQDWLDRHVFRRYVVRGNGKAQGKHLRTRGKSRYGSRLRLQNANRLIEETAEWLLEAMSVDGPFDCVLRSSDDRLFLELEEASQGLFARGPRVETIPEDLPRPDQATLDRARRAADRGTIERLHDGH